MFCVVITYLLNHSDYLFSWIFLCSEFTSEPHRNYTAIAPLKYPNPEQLEPPYLAIHYGKDLVRYPPQRNIHEKVININELQGLAGNKSLEALVDRIENRIRYGMIGDVYDLAATYAVVITVGRVFNDSNKRTAFVSMDTCLEQNGIDLEYDVESVGNMIIRVAQGLVDVTELAHYLRSL